jgi:hypothetical protein
MEVEQLASEEARRGAQHRSIKSKVEGDVNAELAAHADHSTPTEAKKMEQVAIAVDRNDNVYVGDRSNRRIPGRQLKQFSGVHQLACPSEHEVYTAETSNWRVQKLTIQ